VDKGIGLFPDAHKQLAHNMRFPGQLRRISNVLPLAATISEQWVFWLDAFRRRSQNFEQICTRVPSTLLHNLHSHTFTWNTSRYK
jgi:hypothetical protein